jgi:hypothetical protein
MESIQIGIFLKQFNHTLSSTLLTPILRGIGVFLRSLLGMLPHFCTGSDLRY